MINKESDEIDELKLKIKNAEVVLKTHNIDVCSVKRLCKVIEVAKDKIQDLLYNK